MRSRRPFRCWKMPSTPASTLPSTLGIGRASSVGRWRWPWEKANDSSGESPCVVGYLDGIHNPESRVSPPPPPRRFGTRPALPRKPKLLRSSVMAIPRRPHSMRCVVVLVTYRRRRSQPALLGSAALGASGSLQQGLHHRRPSDDLRGFGTSSGGEASPGRRLGMRRVRPNGAAPQNVHGLTLPHAPRQPAPSPSSSTTHCWRNPFDTVVDY